MKFGRSVAVYSSRLLQVPGLESCAQVLVLGFEKHHTPCQSLSPVRLCVVWAALNFWTLKSWFAACVGWLRPPIMLRGPARRTSGSRSQDSAATFHFPPRRPLSSFQLLRSCPPGGMPPGNVFGSEKIIRSLEYYRPAGRLLSLLFPSRGGAAKQPCKLRRAKSPAYLTRLLSSEVFAISEFIDHRKFCAA
jgi:hypothetical protein